MRARRLRCGCGLYICRKQSNFNASASFFSDLHQPFPFLRIDNSMVKSVAQSGAISLRDIVAREYATGY
jgi:hypothetical protein